MRNSHLPGWNAHDFVANTLWRSRARLRRSHQQLLYTLWYVPHNTTRTLVPSQENNAVVKIDIKGCKVNRIYPLGYKVVYSDVRVGVYKPVQRNDLCFGPLTGVAKHPHEAKRIPGARHTGYRITPKLIF